MLEESEGLQSILEEGLESKITSSIVVSTDQVPVVVKKISPVMGKTKALEEEEYWQSSKTIQDTNGKEQINWAI